MASVTMCDVCQNVVKHEQSKYIEIFNVQKNDDTGAKIHTLEICPACYHKLCLTLKLEAK